MDDSFGVPTSKTTQRRSSKRPRLVSPTYGRMVQHLRGALSALAVLLLLVTAASITGCEVDNTLAEESEAPPSEAPFFTRTAALHITNGEDLVGIQGVTVEVLARGGFPDAISGQFRIKWDGASRTMVTNITDAKDVVLAKLTFEPNGFVGWHTHPGPAIVAVSAGELTVTNEVDCVPRKYRSGESFIDPGQGNVHAAVNTSTENAVVYATFVDIPPGQGPTTLVDEHGVCDS